LFEGYVFCRLGADCEGLVIATPGVRRIVGFGGRPCAIEEHEIAALQAVMNSQFPVTPWPLMRLGQKVTIKDGPLAGVTGLLSRIKGSHRLVISVDILMRSVAVDVDAKFLSPVGDESYPNISLYGHTNPISA
jgi:transcription antitermination factor NusG